MTPERATEIGRDALIWLASRPQAMERFIATSGLDPQALRARAAEPEVLGAVLDHVLGSDEAVLDFAGDFELSPEDPSRARAVLAGGLPPHWT